MKAKRLIAALIVLVLCTGAYFLVKNLDLEKTEEEETVYITELDASDITAFSFVRDGQTLSFTKTEDTWSYDGDSSMTMNQTSMASMASMLAKVEAKQVLEDHETLSEYGLDTPSNTVSFTTKAGTKTLLIGNENKAASGHYVMFEGEETVYLISSALPNKFDCGLDTLEETEAETSAGETEAGVSAGEKGAAETAASQSETTESAGTEAASGADTGES